MGKTVPFCRGSCRPKTLEQSGYNNYCKSCFKEKLPKKFAQLTAERYSNPCRLCGEKNELTAAGICMPCTRARSCSSCKEVNEKKRAPQCKHCAAALLGSRSRGRGVLAQQARLAMWCTTCFAPEQIAARLCEDCSGKQQSLDAVGKECIRCRKTTSLADKHAICFKSTCRVRIRLCTRCVSLGQNSCSECFQKTKQSLEENVKVAFA